MTVKPKEGTLIEAVATAGLQGLARALGERLGKGKGGVEIKSLVEDLRNVSEAQGRTEVAVAELLTLFQKIVQDSEGLVLSRRKLLAKASIRFEPTESAPTLGDALLHLDENIRQLRGADLAGVDQSPDRMREAHATGSADPARVEKVVGSMQDHSVAQGTSLTSAEKLAESAHDAGSAALSRPSVLAGLDEEIQRRRMSDGSKRTTE